MVDKNGPEHVDEIVLIDFADQQSPMPFNGIDISDPAALRESISEVMEMLAQQMGLESRSQTSTPNYVGQAIEALCVANLTLQNPPGDAAHQGEGSCGNVNEPSR